MRRRVFMQVRLLEKGKRLEVWESLRELPCGLGYLRKREISKEKEDLYSFTLSCAYTKTFVIYSCSINTGLVEAEQRHTAAGA